MNQNKKASKAGFIIPSVIGIFLFMIPVKFDGSWTIAVKILADAISGAIGGILPILCCIVLTISAVMCVIALFKPKFITENKSRELISKLTSLVSEYEQSQLNRQVIVKGRIKSMNERHIPDS